MSSIYILREILNRVVPGNGGSVRPAEYFDIIGASGTNALAALLFVRFVSHSFFSGYLFFLRSLIAVGSVLRSMKLSSSTTVYPISWTGSKIS